jgi:hypothetical protein
VDNSGKYKRKNVTFGSEPIVDALLFEPIPYRSAVKEGCTHVLVLRTLPDGHSVTGPLPLLQSMIINRFSLLLEIYDISCQLPFNTDTCLLDTSETDFLLCNSGC